MSNENKDLFFNLDVNIFVSALNLRARSILHEALNRCVRDEMTSLPSPKDFLEANKDAEELADIDSREASAQLFHLIVDRLGCSYEAGRRYRTRVYNYLDGDD